MERKDCEYNFGPKRLGGRGLRPRAPAAVCTMLIVAGLAASARAGSVRLWPTAVVVGDTIRVDDLCELRGFEPETEGAFAKLVAADAPPPGGSRVIHIEMLRSVLIAGGANMARVTLGGAIQCEVSRPSSSFPTPPDPSTGELGAVSSILPGGGRNGSSGAAVDATPGLMLTGASNGERPGTLRNAARDYFNKELKRYGGSAELVFDHTSEQILDLSGPTYTFNVRRRNGPPLGLVSLEVDILADGRVIQTVPLVVQVSMVRPVVVATRAINQEATFHPSDLQVVPLTFTRVDKLGVSDMALVIGQRAKRFIPAGSLIERTMLETVPLVVRGQFVTLTSVVGTVRVVTAAKAVETGVLGEVVKVRAANNQRVEFEGIVVGPGKVQIGATGARFPTSSALARGGL